MEVADAADSPSPVAWLLVVVLLAIAGWVFVWSQRKQRFYREHQEQRAYGKNLLLRMSPFVALSVGAALYGVLRGEPIIVVLGLLAVISFAWELRQRWSPPRG